MINGLWVTLTGLRVPEVCRHPEPGRGPALGEQYGEGAGGESETESVQFVFRQVEIQLKSLSVCVEFIIGLYPSSILVIE